MARKKKILESLLIEDVAAEGKSIARTDNLVVFITGGIPGDVVDVLVTKKKSSFMEGRIINYHKYSPDRVDPICSHFGLCGGCKWQNLPYDLQLKYKQKQVSDQLRRIGKIENLEVATILGSPKEFQYRNKLEFTFSNNKWLTKEEIELETAHDRRAVGFHIPGMWDKIVDVEKCHLMDEIANDIRNELRDFAIQQNISFYDVRAHEGLLRNLIVRHTTLGETMVMIQFGAEDQAQIEKTLQFIDQKFPQIHSLVYAVNTKKNDSFYDIDIETYKGEQFINEKIDGLTFRIAPKSFFQTNTYQAENLYKRTIEMAQLTGDEAVYDLYTGTGTIAIFAAQYAKKVVGIETIDQAIHDAKINATINNVTNTVFLTGEVEKVFNEKLFATHGAPEVVITDPPRAGMHQKVIDVLLEKQPKKIIYVSCNPATQARDIALLSPKYEAVSAQPVDMFPHTHHVENIVSLVLRSNL